MVQRVDPDEGGGVKGATPFQLEKPKIILIKHHKNTSTNSHHEDDFIINIFAIRTYSKESFINCGCSL